MNDDKDRRPDVAKEDDAKKSPRKNPKEHWHQPEETLDEGPAGGPDPDKQSRTD